MVAWNKILRLRRYWRLMARIPNRAWTRLLLENGIWPENVSFSQKDSALRINDLDLHLTPDHLFFLRMLPSVRRLAAEARVRFSLTPEGELLADFDNMRVYLQTAEEVDTLSLLLLDHCYSFLTPGPAVVIDVGMNVGIASLYFARKLQVQLVYGFEPFSPTFEQAERNIALNPNVSDKIILNNAGLGDKDCVIFAEYSPLYKASARTTGLPNFLAQAALETTQEEIKIRDAASVLQPILERHADLAVIVKMDCEGAEHQILPALSEAGLLPAVTAFLVEWHEPGPAALQDILARAGFVTLALGAGQIIAGQRMGFLYAVNQKRAAASVPLIQPGVETLAVTHET